jgi:hypothetical protein
LYRTCSDAGCGPGRGCYGCADMNDWSCRKRPQFRRQLINGIDCIPAQHPGQFRKPVRRFVRSLRIQGTSLLKILYLQQNCHLKHVFSTKFMQSIAVKCF